MILSFFRKKLWVLLYVISFIFLGVFLDFSFFLHPEIQQIEGNLIWEKTPKFAVFQKNTLILVSNPNSPEPKVVKKLPVIVTAYSSTPWETDDNPHITASGKWVREGIVANNLLPFGTKIKIPELYGDKVFVVEDRMSWKKGKYQIDIWFPSYWEAKSFGAKRTYIEILEG